MMAQRISEALVKRAQRPAVGEKLYWDDTLKGFGLRVTARGSISFIVQYAIAGGKKKRQTIGRHGTYNVAEARDEAKRILLAVHKNEDPNKPSAAMTVNGVWAQYARDGFPKRRGYKSESTIRSDTNRYKLVAGELGDRIVDSITAGDIERLRLKVARRSPGQAEQVVALIKALMAYARRIGATENIADKSVEVAKAREVHNPLTRDQLAALFGVLKVMQAGDHAFAAYAIELLARTGCRKGEVLPLLWKDVNLADGTIRLRADKASRDGRTVFLNDGARAVLEQMPRIQDQPYVFPGRYGHRHIVNITKPFKAALKAAGCPDVRIHDLRHTFGDLAIESNDLGVVGALMGHRNTQTTKRYAKHRDQQLKEAAARVRIDV